MVSEGVAHVGVPFSAVAFFNQSINEEVICPSLKPTKPKIVRQRDKP